MKVKIYTFSYNRPDFIPLQFKSIKNFIKEDYEYIVFNDGKNNSIRNKIKENCDNLGVKHIITHFTDIKSPSEAHAYLLQWAFHNIIIHDKQCICCLIDPDMFFITETSIEKYLNGYDLAGIPQYRRHVKYLYPNILFLKMDNLPNKENINFMNGLVEGEKTDTGGFLYYWLKQNKRLKIKYIQHTSHIYSKNNNMHCLPDEIKREYNDDYRFDIIDKMILHYGRGSNWDKKDTSFHINKTNLAFRFVNGCIMGDIVLPKYVYKFND
ncbi:hypothetical protein [Alkalihalobacillus sp. BA299]|uniref:hypothetical protein n=1 Tax=Alkalihalobacillus sp. BA299 TaxID=2815938 RepID=UPI001ADB4B62|nr:hypothetical protein [Alkalihalobacillus sp. BA299]